MAVVRTSLQQLQNVKEVFDEFEFKSESESESESESDVTVRVRVCDRDFSVSRSLLPFLSPTLEFWFSVHSDDRKPFVVRCPPNRFGVSAPGLLRCANLLFSHFVDSKPFSVSASDEESFKYLLHSIGSFSLIRSFCFPFCGDGSSFEFQPISLPFSVKEEDDNNEGNDNDNGDVFTFDVCGRVFECSLSNAFLLSKAALRLYRNEFVRSLRIDIPNAQSAQNAQNVDNFVSTFSSLFWTLSGFDFVLSESNIESSLFLSHRLDHPLLLQNCI
jgi:hypothetical protein